jgi:redox-sensitive bicupin YhaK (pirin superfamily)
VEVKIISGESYGVKVGVAPRVLSTGTDHLVRQGPDAPQELAGCWYFDFKLSAGATYAQVLPKGWTAFLYSASPSTHLIRVLTGETSP